MKKKKSPKRPIIFYYVIALLVLFIVNSFVVPFFQQQQVEEVDYSTFLTMVEDERVKQVMKILKSKEIRTFDPSGYEG